ncbi:MAG: hypothetical protein NTU76_01145, partial [Candidatus Taylorbacteria bacterium]|nr:hypothetical protein [Candidatus Taylorbacteria bacterium]
IPTFVGIAIIVLVALVLFGGVFAWQYFLISQKDNQSQNPVACTEEAKICPDGSAVGRTGPNCEFAQCPDQTAGWKTYTNTQYGLEFKYPANLNVQESTNTLSPENLQTLTVFLDSGVVVTAWRTNETDLNKFIYGYIPKEIIEKIDFINLNGAKAAAVKIFGDGEGKWGSMTLITKNGFVYQMPYVDTNKPELVKKIISTLARTRRL